MENQKVEQDLLREVNRLSTRSLWMGVLFLLLIVMALFHLFNWNDYRLAPDTDGSGDDRTFISHVEDFVMEDFPDTEEGRSAAFGQKLIMETAKYLGPNNEYGEVYSGNHLSCNSCHLDGGTKAYAGSYVGLTGIFPMFSERDGKVATLEDRINGCFERSLNGQKLPKDSEEMVAIVSYMAHLSKNVRIGDRIDGQGFVEFTPPDRKANLRNGEQVFQAHCVACHQQDGQGIWKDDTQKSEGYIYPPLWGHDSYNDGAGMGRMLTASKFIKGNMPLGVDPLNPILTDEEVYDVAAYINSFDRPIKANKEKDYPDLTLKPKDSAYPPFADSISPEQHKYGPYNF